MMSAGVGQRLQWISTASNASFRRDGWKFSSRSSQIAPVPSIMSAPGWPSNPRHISRCMRFKIKVLLFSLSTFHPLDGLERLHALGDRLRWLASALEFVFPPLLLQVGRGVRREAAQPLLVAGDPLLHIGDQFVSALVKALAHPLGVGGFLATFNRVDRPKLGKP